MPIAFNIVASKGDDNAAWLVTGGALYSVDLKTGKATAAGKLDGVKGKLDRHRLDRLNLVWRAAGCQSGTRGRRRADPGPLIGPSEGVPRKVGRFASKDPAARCSRSGPLSFGIVRASGR